MNKAYYQNLAVFVILSILVSCTLKEDELAPRIVLLVALSIGVLLAYAGSCIQSHFKLKS